MSIYETSTMLEAIENTKPVFTFLRDVFFGDVETLVTEKAEVDIKKGRRKMAPFVAPRVGGVILEREGFKTDVITTPKIAPKRIITAETIKKRSLGENVYSKKTPAERAAAILSKDVIELDESITRREEWLCCQVLLGEKIVIKPNKGTEQVIDFGFDNKKKLSGDKLWSSNKSTPIKDLESWRKDIIKKSGKNPNICVMSSDVVNLFLDNPDIRELFDIKRVALGSIEPTYKGDGLTYVGNISSLGIEIYSYLEFYEDEDGNVKELIPEGTVILGSRNIGKRFYGSVTQKENGGWATYEGIRIPKYTEDNKNEVDELRLTARPLPTPYDLDSWGVYKVI